MSLSVLQPAMDSYETTRLAAPGIDRSTDASSSPSAASLFGSRLDHAQTAGQSEDEQLKELTEMLVSTAFIMPMFEKMRNDPLASNLFHGGRGEKVFQQQLDQVISDRISSASSLGLADALYNQFSRGKRTGQAVNTNG